MFFRPSFLLPIRELRPQTVMYLSPSARLCYLWDETHSTFFREPKINFVSGDVLVPVVLREKALPSMANNHDIYVFFLRSNFPLNSYFLFIYLFTPYIAPIRALKCATRSRPKKESRVDQVEEGRPLQFLRLLGRQANSGRPEILSPDYGSFPQSTTHVSQPTHHLRRKGDTQPVIGGGHFGAGTACAVCCAWSASLGLHCHSAQAKARHLKSSSTRRPSLDLPPLPDRGAFTGRTTEASVFVHLPAR